MTETLRSFVPCSVQGEGVVLAGRPALSLWSANGQNNVLLRSFKFKYSGAEMPMCRRAQAEMLNAVVVEAAR